MVKHYLFGSHLEASMRHAIYILREGPSKFKWILLLPIEKGTTPSNRGERVNMDPFCCPYIFLPI